MTENETTLTPGGKIKQLEIEDEMRTSYINYAMSVIVGRALPDVRDGLKPVHRRILFSMNEQGMVAGKAFKKSARVVGDVLGKYHPHGDSSVYDAMVRLAQDFSMRYPFVDGQGNFGSVDGDSAAAMRYTEARLAKIASEMMSDLDKGTVNFMPNFDESLEEPVVLPAKIPNLLINGSTGIAVGMATNIPPHNLTEVCDGLVSLIDNPEITISELMQYIKGPDFPTGANICGTAGIRSAFETGRGSITVRAQISIEEAPHKKDRECIIVTELPYQVNKANLIIKIADLVKDKKIQSISDLRDESGKQGMRIYIELKKGASPEVVLNQLYKHTQLQDNFGIINLALVNGIPRVLNLKETLAEFIKHRIEIVTRRTQFLLKKAQDREHILVGLVIALDNIDEIIELIKKAKDAATAKEQLMTRFNLSEIQTQAILDMRLQRLTGLETDKLRQEYQEVLAQIAEYQDILANKERLMIIIKEELLEIKTKYGDARRSRIIASIENVEIEDLIPKEDVVVLTTRQGFIKRMPVDMFRTQMRGGRGIAGMETRDEDEIDSIFSTSTHSFMVIFTNLGKAYKVKVYELPDATRISKGQSIANFVQMEENEKITATLEVSDFKVKGQYIVMATKNGVVKKTELTDFENMRRTGIIAINLDEGDSLDWAQRSKGTNDIMMTSKSGLLIRFSEKNVRSMGRATRGVRGMNLISGDYVVSMDVLAKEDDKKLALLVSKMGFGKLTEVGEYRCQGRGGKGVRCLALRDGDEMVKMRIVNKDDTTILVSSGGTIIRQKVKNISTQGRAAKGVRLVKLVAGENVADLAVIKKIEEKTIEA